MKKYNKPELKVEVIYSNNDIANTVSNTLPHVNNFGNDAGTVTWEDLFK